MAIRASSTSPPRSAATGSKKQLFEKRKSYLSRPAESASVQQLREGAYRAVQEGDLVPVQTYLAHSDVGINDTRWSGWALVTIDSVTCVFEYLMF